MAFIYYLVFFLFLFELSFSELLLPVITTGTNPTFEMVKPSIVS